MRPILVFQTLEDPHSVGRNAPTVRVLVNVHSFTFESGFRAVKPGSNLLFARPFIRTKCTPHDCDGFEQARGNEVQSDLAYVRRRAAQERRAAAAASSKRSRSIHNELAKQYEEILTAQTVPGDRVGLSDAQG